MPLLSRIWDLLVHGMSGAGAGAGEVDDASADGRDRWRPFSGGGVAEGQGLASLFSVSLGILHVLEGRLLASDLEDIHRLLSRHEAAAAALWGQEEVLLDAVAAEAHVDSAEVCVCYIFQGLAHLSVD